MKSTLILAVALCLAATAAYAGVTINGTTITFNDNTMQSTAKPTDHGGTNNAVSGTDSFIGGGKDNLVTDDFGTIGGGDRNQAGDDGGTIDDKKWATVGGGVICIADGRASTVGGGYFNTASGGKSTIGGGGGNDALGDQSTIAGGDANLVTDDFGTIGGGQLNVVGDNALPTNDTRWGTVSGGLSNTASGILSSIVGGYSNVASGSYSTVGGGYKNTASGDYSFVAGESANDGGYNHVFVWDDGTGSDATAANTFNVNASGGILLNGLVAHVSDRNMKDDFSFVSAREVLDKVVEMPVSTWRFRTEDESVRHIGPMAQDFMAAFGYGKSDKHIVSTDADGVALAAIQGLNGKVEDQAETITALRWHNAQLNSRNDSLEARLRRLEKAILREGEPTGTD